jgi:hypothetical protein
MSGNYKVLPVATQIAIVAATNAALRALGRARTPIELRNDGPLGWQPSVGATVRVKSMHRWPGLPDVTFAIQELVGRNDNAMAKLRGPSGDYFKWFRVNELWPAGYGEGKEGQMVNPEERIMMRAQSIANERQISLSAATKIASREEEAASRDYLAHPEPTVDSSPVMNLRRGGETLPAMVARVARERCNGDQVVAYRLVASAHPDLISAYSDGTTL